MFRDHNMLNLSPHRVGMVVHWENKNETSGFELREQKQVGQARMIKTNNWLLDLELEQPKREIA